MIRNGETALKVFPPLMEIYPESKLNYAIYLLKNDHIKKAFNLLKDFKPISSRDYILKAVVHCLYG